MKPQVEKSVERITSSSDCRRKKQTTFSFPLRVFPYHRSFYSTLNYVHCKNQPDLQLNLTGLLLLYGAICLVYIISSLPACNITCWNVSTKTSALHVISFMFAFRLKLCFFFYCSVKLMFLQMLCVLHILRIYTYVHN